MRTRKGVSEPGKEAREAAVAHGLPNVDEKTERDVARLSKTIRRYVKKDIEEQRAAVERLMVEGAGRRQIARTMRILEDERGQKRWPNITDRTVELRITQVYELRKKDLLASSSREERDQARAYMIERLQDMRQRALVGKSPNYKAAIACEREIAKLQGLYAATKVEVAGNVQHSHAMLSVIANMDPDQATELLEEAKETRRLADEARRLLPSVVTADTASKRG